MSLILLPSWSAAPPCGVWPGWPLPDCCGPGQYSSFACCRLVQHPAFKQHMARKRRPKGVPSMAAALNGLLGVLLLAATGEKSNARCQMHCCQQLPLRGDLCCRTMTSLLAPCRLLSVTPAGD